MKILNILNKNFTPGARSILNKLGEVHDRTVTHKELLKIAGQYDVILIGLYPMIDKAVIDRAQKLKYILIPANTLENINVDYAVSKGIKVVSLWGETKFLKTITGTAELAMGLLLDIVRFTPWAFDSVKRYKWERERFRGHNLYGKTLGIVGMGRLGGLMAGYGKAFGMRIIFYSPHTKNKIRSYQKVSFHQLLRESDFISIHAHLNEDTEHMFNAKAFKKMKSTAYLINTARGKIVDEKALLKSLKKGDIAGYAADVLADEFHFDDTSLAHHPLIDYAKIHRNVLIVPHTGGMTHESREATDIFVVRKFEKLLHTVQ